MLRYLCPSLEVREPSFRLLNHRPCPPTVPASEAPSIDGGKLSAIRVKGVLSITARRAVRSSREQSR